MKIRWFTFITVLFVTALLAACGGSSAPSEEAAPAEQESSAEQAPAEEAAAEEESAAPAEAPEGVTELQLMGWSSSDAENERLQEVVDTFNTNNPDIEVSLNLIPSYDEKLQTSLAGGSPPDVFYVDSFRLPDLAEANAIEPAEGKLDNPEDFYENLRNAFMLDGTFYCPPKDFSTLALQYNQDMFDAAGLDYPTADWTWDDLRAAAEQLTNDEQYGIVLSADFARWIAFLYQSGGSVADDGFTTMTINSPEAQEALDFYVNLILDGYAAPPQDLDSGWNGEAFGKGRAAMAVEGNWMVPFMTDQYPDVNYGVAELPSGPGGKATMAFTVCYAVAKDSPNQDAAFQLVNFLTGEEGMKQWTDLGLAMPTRQSLREGWLANFADLEPFLNGADYAYKWQFRPGFKDVEDTVNDGLQQAFSGSLLPEDVLIQVEEVGNEVLLIQK